MTIRFHNVTPDPLAGVTDVRTDIWGKDPSFEQGESHQVVAPSGKGKTTFVHMVYGLRSDYAGEISFGEENIRVLQPNQWATLRRDKFSIVFQDLRLFLQLTGRENIMVKSALHKFDATEKVDEMANALQVSQVLDRPCQALSYGERQRIAIIRALVQPFEWLLLDEPFSHLDDENARKAEQLILGEVKQRKAGLIVTTLGMSNYFDCDHHLML